MADPLLDEPLILMQLNVPVSADTVDRLQQGCLLSVIDGFDRKVQRDPFVALAAMSMSLVTQLSQLEILDRMIEFQKEDKLTTEKLEEAKLSLVASAETARLSIRKSLEMIARCPTSEDTVN